MITTDINIAIESMTTPPTEEELINFKNYILQLVNAHQTNKDILQSNLPDENGKTPCHYAVEKSFHVLAILALEGGMRIPEDLPYPHAEHIQQLRAEQEKHQKEKKSLYLDYHLHSLIRSGKVHAELRNSSLYAQFRSGQNGRFNNDQLIYRRMLSHPSEIEQCTYLNRHAGHWAAIKNRADYLEKLAAKGCNLHAKDLDGRTPLDLATTEECKEKIRELLKTYPEKLPEAAVVHAKKLSNDEIKPDMTFAVLLQQENDKNPLMTSTNSSSTSSTSSHSAHPKSNKMSPFKTWSFRGKQPRSHKSKAESPSKESLGAVQASAKSVQVSVARSITTASLSSRSENLVADLGVLGKIFANDNLAEFEIHYRTAGSNPNGVIQNINQTYLIHAFLSGSFNIFSFLMNQGADLTYKTSHGKALIEYALETEAPRERLGFLKEVLSRLMPTLFEKRKRAQEELKSLEKTFEEKLPQKGFNKQVKNKGKELSDQELIAICQIEGVPEQVKSEASLARVLYELCYGMLDSDAIENINPVVIQQYVVGLLLKHPPEKLIKILKDLFPHLQTEQQCISLMIIKDIIMLDQFHFCFRDKQFSCETLLNFFLPTFSEENELKVHADLYQLFRKMIECQKEIHKPLLSNIMQLESLIAKLDDSMPDVPKKDYKALAAELRALTRHDYLNVSLADFMHKKWAKPETSPTLVKQADRFNKLTDYFTLTILTAASLEESIGYIKTYINTLHSLIFGEIPDITTAMALSATFDNSEISKLLKILKEKDGATYARLEALKETFNPNGNFKVVREITANGKPFSMPYMGIINKDLTFVAENNDLKTIVGIEGRLVLEILQLQQLLIEYRALTPKCRLANILHQQKSVTSDQQIVLSNRVNLCPIPLGRTTPSLCMSLLEVYAEKKLPLKVRYNGEEKVGFDAIESVFDWLKESLKNGVITDNQVIGALIEKMFGLPDANSFIQIQQAKFLRWLNLEYRKEETLTYLLNKIQIRDEENNQRRANSTVSSPSSSFSRSRPQSN